MTPYRVDVRRPDGWHTLTVRAASPEMATSYALRSTHDALEARQAVVDESAAPQNDPETPHRRNNGVSSWGPPKPGTHESDLPVCGLPFGSVPGDTDANHERAKHWSRENAPPWKAQGRVLPAGGMYLIGEAPPKPDMSIAWGITEALIEDRGR